MEGLDVELLTLFVVKVIVVEGVSDSTNGGVYGNGMIGSLAVRMRQ